MGSPLPSPLHCLRLNAAVKLPDGALGPIWDGTGADKILQQKYTRSLYEELLSRTKNKNLDEHPLANVPRCFRNVRTQGALTTFGQSECSVFLLSWTVAACGALSRPNTFCWSGALVPQPGHSVTASCTWATTNRNARPSARRCGHRP
jgi:hypothetical protein